MRPHTCLCRAVRDLDGSRLPDHWLYLPPVTASAVQGKIRYAAGLSSLLFSASSIACTPAAPCADVANSQEVCFNKWSPDDLHTFVNRQSQQLFQSNTNLLYPYEIQNQRPHVPTFGSINEGDRSTTKAGVKVVYSEVAVFIPIKARRPAAGRHRDKQANEGSYNYCKGPREHPRIKGKIKPCSFEHSPNTTNMFIPERRHQFHISRDY
jgi:hypothetical protein